MKWILHINQLLFPLMGRCGCHRPRNVYSRTNAMYTSRGNINNPLGSWVLTKGLPRPAAQSLPWSSSRALPTWSFCCSEQRSSSLTFRKRFRLFNICTFSCIKHFISFKNFFDSKSDFVWKIKWFSFDRFKKYIFYYYDLVTLLNMFGLWVIPRSHGWL